jgi:hypothetical protein
MAVRQTHSLSPDERDGLSPPAKKVASMPVDSCGGDCRVPQIGVLADLCFSDVPQTQVSEYRDLWHRRLASAHLPN